MVYISQHIREMSALVALEQIARYHTVVSTPAPQPGVITFTMDKPIGGFGIGSIARHKTDVWSSEILAFFVQGQAVDGATALFEWDCGNQVVATCRGYNFASQNYGLGEVSDIILFQKLD